MFRFVWTPRNMWLEAIDHRYPSGTQVIHLRPLASTPVRISDNRLHDWPIVVGAIGVTLRYQLANRAVIWSPTVEESSRAFFERGTDAS
jgi:hypothetical protein